MQQNLAARIGLLVITKRREADLTQAELAGRLVDCRQNQISDIERGKRLDVYNVNYRNRLREIAVALGLKDPHYFSQYDERPAPESNLGRKLRFERVVMRGLTQEQTAAELGCEQETVSAVERDPLYPISVELARRIKNWIASEPEEISA